MRDLAPKDVYRYACEDADVTPVSYTHLDVYKRQSQYIVFSFEIRKFAFHNHEIE